MELASSQDEANENSLFLKYKKQLISLGFSHREAKTVLKYIIKYYDNVLIHKSIIFADIYYFYEFFFQYEPRDPFSKLICRILNKWANNNKKNYSKYWYLYGKLYDFGEYIPHVKLFVEIESVAIAKILSLYFHKKQNEKDDILIMKDIIDNNMTMFYNEEHANVFFQHFKRLFRTKMNWKIFIKEIESNNIYKLPVELIDTIYENIKNIIT